VSENLPLHFSSALRRWWLEQAREAGCARAAFLLLRNFCDFLRDSMPDRARQRYGDMEYDWEHRVNTTSGTVGWRARLLGMFHSPYQPTEPSLFREMMASLPIDFGAFTFVDIGSGKGRTLLMASEYPFRRIVGIELIAELHRAAEENIRAWHSEAQPLSVQQCSRIEAVLGDAREFEFPEVPLVLYFFNPLPESAFSDAIERLIESLARAPRPLWIVYHNPLLERVLGRSGYFSRSGGTEQYAIYAYSVNESVNN
jgi:SAM-dependent methyltransferase